MIGVFFAKKAITDWYEAISQHNLSNIMSIARDDVVYVYPGEIPNVSGTYTGKDVVEGFVLKWLGQFPRLQFDIQSICFQNIFDFTGTNVAAVHWNLELTNRDGVDGTNSGVTLCKFKRGKAFLVKDFFFDQGENLKRYWSIV